MGGECFEVTVEAKVAHLRLSRPERMNAMTLAFWRELPAIVTELETRGDVRAAVISSTGKHFTAGMDLSVFNDSPALDTSSVAGRQRFFAKLV
ncbi:MAG: enoyl-CoA hydratase/isomerase family protein [Betaproteobacteria bacterium]|nr:enoyl-CoA hydratase/isomerase family protein [Betaproteobacteria bacterium]